MSLENIENINHWNQWMRRALQLASLGQGTTSPNPLVGAVVLDKKGNLVGEGYHARAGYPHAEIGALFQAGGRARGGYLVVTLEPCCHEGKTPPCTKAIVDAGIKTVVVAIEDPDPRVSGKGISFLKNAGIEVIKGVLENEAAFQNKEFIFRIKNRRPWGVLKIAMSADGRIALPNGKSKWITGENSRELVHSLRSKCDAIVVGGATVRNDDPLMTSRGISSPEPRRVVLTRNFNFSKNLRIFDTKLAETIISFGPEINKEKFSEINKGVELLQLRKSEPRYLSVALAEKGCNRILWECGPNLSTSAISQNCVQEVVIFMAPKILGGKSCMTPLGDLGFLDMRDVLVTSNYSFQKQGADMLFRFFT